MGDRISIQFKQGKETSVVLFSHWGGLGFLNRAEKYVEFLQAQKGDKYLTPLDRLEPNTVMVDFIRVITKDEDQICGGIYLGVDENDGDNSDNGHHVIVLEEKRVL